MKRIRALSLVCYNLSRIAAIIFIATIVYTGISLILHTSGIDWAPVEVSGNGFTIFYPFTKVPFLLGDYTASFITMSISTLLLYGIFLWLLGKVFYVFMQQKIFIQVNMNRLRNFYLFNLLAPFVPIICMLILGEPLQNTIIIALLHFLLGIFIYFMTTIFQQGLVLQEEQDQTL